MSDHVKVLAEALRNLLQDTQHVDHYCGDVKGCPVIAASAALAAYDAAPAWTPPPDLQQAAQKVASIWADLQDFDGDRRGHYSALEEAVQQMTTAAILAFPSPQEASQ